MPKYPVDKYGFTIFPKDSPYLDAQQAEDSDDGEEMNARAVRDLPAYLAEFSGKLPKPGETAVAASTSQSSSSAAQPLESENFDYSLPIFRVQSKAALEQLYEGIKGGKVGFNQATGLFELKSKSSSSTAPSEPGAWVPSSWKYKLIAQHAIYNNLNGLRTSKDKLEHLPPIVTPTEIVKLKKSLRDVAEGKAFLLQGGDCAELFDYCEEGAIESKIKLLLQMSLVLIWGSNKPVVRIARMAGQYAKPRSSPTEIVDGVEIPSFRGDILNGYAVTERTLDPARLVAAYFYSASTLNFMRGSLASGIADLHRPLDWGLGHVRDPELQAKYSGIVSSITDSLRFMRTVGADTAGQLQTVDIFTSHEGLLLEYEESLTRLLKNPPDYVSTSRLGATDSKSYFDTSAHFIWIGDRTRQIDGAHVEFCRGIENPIGIKVGPTTAAADLLALLRTINPTKEVGKITLITRYGAGKVRDLLPTHIRTVENSEFAKTVVWQCDPMHGNTRSTATGIKTRQFADILSELQQSLAIHKKEGSYLGGVHLELTGDAVTECTGGSEGLTDEHLSLNYTSFCDPRLNEKQALELAFLIAGHYRGEGADSS